jgi:integral membrane protein (TIGR01906 family)
MRKRLLSTLFALALVLFVLSAAIGLPIYIRPFYYAHIGPLGLEEYTGLTAQQLREAYNGILDYLTLPNRPFSCGILPFSAEGEAHFADCRVLFDLNRNVLLGSGAVLAVLLALGKKFGPYRLGKRHAAWWAGLLALIAPLVIGSLAALDFDRAFVIFHQIFFPGKSNWLFDWRTDPIILALPQEFFRNCAILIGAGLIAFSLTLLIFSALRDRKSRTS